MILHKKDFKFSSIERGRYIVTFTSDYGKIHSATFEEHEINNVRCKEYPTNEDLSALVVAIYEKGEIIITDSKVVHAYFQARGACEDYLLYCGDKRRTRYKSLKHAVTECYMHRMGELAKRLGAPTYVDLLDALNK